MTPPMPPETPETASRLRPMTDLDTALTVAAMRPGITPGKAMTMIEALRGAGWLSPTDLPAHKAMVRKQVLAELFGTPEEIAARAQEPLTVDDPIELCERIRPGGHEERVRAKVAEEILAEVCAPGEQCDDRFCVDCIRHTQQQRDAEIARGTQP